MRVKTADIVFLTIFLGSGKSWRLAQHLNRKKIMNSPDMLGLMFNELSEEQHKYWREILAENFDYDKYEKKWKLIDLVIKSRFVEEKYDRIYGRNA